MRPRQTLARLGHAEVAVLRVGAQAVGFKVLFAVMADGDALSWPGPLDGSRRAALGLEFLSRRGFGGGLGRVLGRVLARGLARRRFFLRGGLLPLISASAWPSTFSPSLSRENVSTDCVKWSGLSDSGPTTSFARPMR